MYAVNLFKYETNDVPPMKVDKVVLIYWAHSGSKIKNKMIYSSAY